MLVHTCAVKLLELILAVACVVLYQYSYDLTDVPTLILCSGTYVGYVIILSGEIIGELTFFHLDLVQDMFYSLLGAILYCACGGLALKNRFNPTGNPSTGDFGLAITCASCSVVNAVVMLFDLGLAYVDSEEMEQLSI